MRYQIKFPQADKIEKSPDGKYFATLSNSVVLWDAANGEKVATFVQIRNPYYFSFSVDGKLLAVKNTSGKIALFDMDKMCHLYSLQPTKTEGCELIFTPDDKYIISADWNGRIYIIDSLQKSVNILKKDTFKYRSLEYRDNQFILHGIKTIKNRYHSFIEFWRYPFDGFPPIVIESKTEFDIVTFTTNRTKCAAVDSFKKAILIMDEYLNETYKTIYMYNEKKKKLNIIWVALLVA